MELNKVVLFYKFTPITDPNAVRLWQRDLCESLELKGRILISEHGINATVGGSLSAVKKYVAKTREFPGFKHIDFKWSDGNGEDFPNLKVKVRDEIVSFGAPGELKVDDKGVIGGGVHLSPDEVHELVAARGDDVVFFDGRNTFEAEIGRFKGAIVPDVETTRDFISEIESGKYDHLKDRPIVTYCTGGIRCEVLSSLMINRGFNEIYQMRGGIVRYAEQFGNQGLWEGSLYIFDKRMNQEFGPDTTVLGSCEHCSTPTSSFHNCSNLNCRKLILLCDDCATLDATTMCGPQHGNLVRR